MLDTATKRRIDTARDILVGKVPDPKSQVEQITIALIYKFMDDMDAEAEELGGKRTFFAGEFAKYGWAKLMRSGLGGHEMLGLYAEAITRMPENPGVPPLFRDIFKNAYLPYRDPETLRAFLKIIDEFEYDHSERLGDAFEYLLSVLGSQGDAGQFRTPRHIIDFIVAIVDPKKGDTILDPACGTAGFLISAWKHILAANRDANGESSLTPEEQEGLAGNINGYDISPDMVRLSLANMYLHGFTDPHIVEYDTLTSEERWNEFADVILANPPFMSPKGGIKPHNRFGVQSNRSEVLFVDYMAEHLTPNGRAGIIVPEGVIFQSGKAYKALRKELVEKYLVAVVSLPAGLFNPYSGVKTSILILDRAAAKASDTIGFFKVTNDGFNLGAQRREISGSELPEVLAEITEYRAHAGEEAWQGRFGRAVEKKEIAKSPDYNLSGDRYCGVSGSASSWPIISFGDAFEKVGNTVEPASLVGPVNYVGLENITQGTGELVGDVVVADPSEIKSLKNVFRSGDILYGKLRPNLNKAWLADRDGICSTDIFVLRPRDGSALASLFSVLVRSQRFNLTVVRQLQGAQLPRVSWSSFEGLEIPLPPIDVQREIVAEIESYQRVIEGGRAVVESYRPQIAVDPAWPILELSRLTKPEYGFTDSASDNGTARFIRITDISENGTLRRDGAKFIQKTRENERYLLREGDILVARTGATFGKTVLFSETYDAIFASYLIRLRFDEGQVDAGYYWAFAQSSGYWDQANSLVSGGGQPQFNGNALSRMRVPLPPLEKQREIVAELEAERALVEANRELIARMEKKIDAAIARVWGAADGTRLSQIAAE